MTWSVKINFKINSTITKRLYYIYIYIKKIVILKAKMRASTSRFGQHEGFSTRLNPSEKTELIALIESYKGVV
jgi:hypothetical protein